MTLRLETTSENIARDMREGRFPERSEPQMVEAERLSAFDRIMADPKLAAARRKLSADEIMTMIRYVWAAEEAGTKSTPSSPGPPNPYLCSQCCFVLRR